MSHSDVKFLVQTARQKLSHASFLVKKSKRSCLYELLGVSSGERATEREIRAGYKRKALQYHPVRAARQWGSARSVQRFFGWFIQRISDVAMIISNSLT